MLDLYFSPTPNARKISILLEEIGLSYRSIYVDIMGGDQFRPEFLALNPNNKIPVLVDSDGPTGEPIVIWETGAIMLYLAEKHGAFLPPSGDARYACFQWLMFQMAGLGPMGGQHAFFSFYAAEKIPLAVDRYRNELNRQFGVMDKHLETNRYFAGEDYSLADMAIYPWWAGLGRDSDQARPALDRWADEISARPAVQRGMAVLIEKVRSESYQANSGQRMSAETFSTLYGARQYRKEAV